MMRTNSLKSNYLNVYFECVHKGMYTDKNLKRFS